MSSANLRRSLGDFRERLETLMQTRRQERLIRLREQQDDAGILRQFALSADVKYLMDRLADAVRHDVQRYAPQPVVVPASPHETDISVTPTPALGPYVQDFTKCLMKSLTPPAGSIPMNDPADTYFAHLFHHELIALNEDPALLTFLGNANLPKLKKAYEAFTAKRPGDALTILRTAQRNDPHNHILAFLLSQLLYLHAARGQQDALPEARELAQRTIIPSDRLPSVKLATYQYHALATECYFGTERMMSWLRESKLLATEPLDNKECLLANMGVHLRTWQLLSTIPFVNWGEDELNALKKLTVDVVGGGMLYLAMFHQQLATESALRKEPIPAVEAMAEQLRTAYQYYINIAPNLSHLPIAASHLTWLVRNRYLNTLASLTHPPGFDHVLLHVALNGSSWRVGTYPDTELRAALDDTNLSYWRIWNQAISPTREYHHDHVLPVNDALEEAALLADCDKLFEELHQAETEKITATVWDMIKPWMVRWHMDHLLAAGTGTTKPRVKFAPTTAPLSHYYRRWNEPSPNGILATDIIAETARRGAFGNLFEVAAAFEGALRLLDDPVHGLVPLQKRALQAAKQQEPERFGSLAIDDGRAPNIALLLLPLGLFAGIAAAVALSKNWGQTIGLVLVISGITGLASVSLTRR